jgi:hypothetical protein
LAVGLRLADETISTGGNLADMTGAGRLRSTVNTVTNTARAAIAANAMTPARPGSARIRASQPAPV